MWNLQLLVAVRTLRVWYKLTQLLKYIIYAIFFCQRMSSLHFKLFTPVSHITTFRNSTTFNPFQHFFGKKCCCFFCSFEPKIKNPVLIAGSSLCLTCQYFKVHCDAA